MSAFARSDNTQFCSKSKNINYLCASAENTTQIVDLPEYRSIGVSEHRSIGLSEYRIIGVLEFLLYSLYVYVCVSFVSICLYVCIYPKLFC